MGSLVYLAVRRMPRTVIAAFGDTRLGRGHEVFALQQVDSRSVPTRRCGMAAF